jgi:hypothetical protein
MKGFALVLFTFLCLVAVTSAKLPGGKEGEVKEHCFPKTVEYLCDETNVLEACREACPGITDCELIEAVVNSKCKLFLHKSDKEAFTCDPKCGK